MVDLDSNVGSLMAIVAAVVVAGAVDAVVAGAPIVARGDVVAGCVNEVPDLLIVLL